MGKHTKDVQRPVYVLLGYALRNEGKEAVARCVHCGFYAYQTTFYQVPLTIGHWCIKLTEIDYDGPTYAGPRGYNPKHRQDGQR